MRRIINTKKKGIMEFLYYKEGNKFVGVCLTFNIIEEGDDFIVLKQSLEEASKLHLKVVCKKNLSDDLLNRSAPEKYWKMYFECLERLAKRDVIRKIEKGVSTASIPFYSSFNVGLGMNCPA